MFNSMRKRYEVAVIVREVIDEEHDRFVTAANTEFSIDMMDPQFQFDYHSLPSILASHIHYSLARLDDEILREIHKYGMDLFNDSI
jgi:hypothetical protein